MAIIKNKQHRGLAFLLGSALLWAAPAPAQLHRATHLGHPATRFAPPLQSAQDLRARFRDPALRPDIAAILRQSGWSGNLEDLYRAAESNEVSEVRLPVGTRMPFMSSRKDGRPIALADVLWEGPEPVPAFAFTFTSKGRRYRCVTPKPCSNFYLVDLGLEGPKLHLAKSAPAEARACEPFETALIVRNVSPQPLTHVRILDTLPAGLKTTQGQTNLAFEVGMLAPGASRQYRFKVVAQAGGSYLNQARAVCAEGGAIEASARIVVRPSALALQCQAPPEVALGRPVKVCLTLRNHGRLSEALTTVTLPIPPGAAATAASEGAVADAARLVWEIKDLAPQTARQVCAVFVSPAPGSLVFDPTIRGSCGQPESSQCVTRVVGVPGILLEVVDLEDPIEVGHEVTYVIKVVNQGSANLTRLQLVGTLPESQAFVSGSGATPVQVQDRTITMGTLDVLKPKTEAAWRVAVKALQAGDVRFRTELRCDEFSRPVQETEATQQY